METQSTISKNQIQTRTTFKQGLVDCLPTALGYLSISFAAGVLETTAGMSILEIALISILVYAGSGQFIAAAMFMVASPPTAIIITIFFVNLRHLLMSSSISKYFPNIHPFKGALIGGYITDETFAIGITQGRKQNFLTFDWMFGVNITAYLTWVTGNILGGIFGKFIPNPEVFGLDFAVSAMFIVILVANLTNSKHLSLDLKIIIVTGISMIITTFLGFSYFSIIVSTMIGATYGWAVSRCK